VISRWPWLSVGQRLTSGRNQAKAAAGLAARAARCVIVPSRCALSAQLVDGDGG